MYNDILIKLDDFFNDLKTQPGYTLICSFLSLLSLKTIKTIFFCFRGLTENFEIWLNKYIFSCLRNS